MEEETSTWGLGCSLMAVGRPIFAVLLVITLILLGWVAAWKLVLVHVPLVQEVFGLRKKPSAEARPKHVTSGRFSHLYDSNRSKSKSSSRLQQHCMLLSSCNFGLKVQEREPWPFSHARNGIHLNAQFSIIRAVDLLHLASGTGYLWGRTNGGLISLGFDFGSWLEGMIQ